MSQTTPQAGSWLNVAYGNGVFVAVAESGASRVMTSPDGVTWTLRASADDTMSWYGVTYGAGLFVAVANSGSGNRVMTSPDGIYWTSRPAAANSGWTVVTYGNGLFVAVANSGATRVMTSPDGIIWTARAAAAASTWRSVTYGSGQFVAVADSGATQVMTSPDGINWTAQAAAAARNWHSVTFGGGLFVAVAYTSGRSDLVMKSSDGIAWTSSVSPGSCRWFNIGYGDGLFVAAGGGNCVMTSRDGASWNTSSPPLTGNWRGISYNSNRFVVVSYSTADPTRRVITGDRLPSDSGIAPQLEITALGPIGISVVPNLSLQGTGTVTMVANQSGTWTATTSTPWLALTQNVGGFPGTLAATANAAGLAVGTYAGSISVTGSGAGGTQTVTVPVTLTVNSPAALTADLTSISLASGYPGGSATGFSIKTGAPGLSFTVSTSASSASWLKISPASGIAPTPIAVTLDPGKATPGIYTDSIIISSPGVASVTIPVKMSVSGGIITSLPQQVSAATQAGPDHTVAPNQIVTLYLTNFSCSTAPVVSINGKQVSWSSYVEGQLNYAVPENITAPAALTVACNGNTAWSFNGLTTAAVVPGIFTVSGTGKGQAAIVNSDGSINGGTTPATRGQWLSVYGTGFGAYNAAGSNGLKTLAGTVTATIGGEDATVLYAGNTPGGIDGLQQFNLQVPAGITPGSAVPIVLTVNGTPSQTTATAAIR